MEERTPLNSRRDVYKRQPPVQHKPSQAGWAHPGGSEHVVGRVKGEHFTVENGMGKGKSCCSLYVQQL